MYKREDFSFVGSKSSSNENDFQNQNKTDDQKFKQKDEFNQDPPPKQDDEIPF